MAICLILLVFAGWHAVTHARESQELKGIPGIGQYICGNDISTIEDKKFWGSQAKSARENEVLSRTAIIGQMFTKTVIILSFGVCVDP